MRRGFLKKEYSADELCDFLRGEFKRQEITQTEAAAFIGISQGMFSRKLKNGDISIRELKSLMQLTGIDKEQIVRYL